MNRFPITAALLFSSFVAVSQLYCQQNDQSPTLARFPFEDSVPLKIIQEAVPSKPFTVTGPRGAIMGQQDGTFEAWIFPWKILSHLRISAEMENYAVPIDVNEQAALIEVRPDHTTITFAHANFTVREVLFAPHNPPDGAGALAFFQIEAVRPMTLTVQFTPEMKRMWPASSDDYSSAEWVKTDGGGFYALHLSFPDQAAAIEIPGAQPGILAPYQERAKTYPAQFVLHFDPRKDANKLFPLLLTMSESAADSKNAALAAKLAELGHSFRSLYEETGKYYKDFLAERIAIETPDKQFDDAFAWAEVSIDRSEEHTSELQSP